jgi:subtilisin family serine protease
MASYSNRGSNLTLVAPTDSPAVEKRGLVFDFGGTSCANPNMAAIASLVWSVNPALTGGELRQILIDTAYDLGDTGDDNQFGNGLVNADAAVRRAVALARNPEVAGLYGTSWDFPDHHGWPGWGEDGTIGLTSAPSTSGEFSGTFFEVPRSTGAYRRPDHAANELVLREEFTPVSRLVNELAFDKWQSARAGHQSCDTTVAEDASRAEESCDLPNSLLGKYHIDAALAAVFAAL